MTKIFSSRKIRKECKSTIVCVPRKYTFKVKRQIRIVVVGNFLLFALSYNTGVLQFFFFIYWNEMCFSGLWNFVFKWNSMLWIVIFSAYNMAFCIFRFGANIYSVTILYSKCIWCYFFFLLLFFLFLIWNAWTVCTLFQILNSIYFDEWHPPYTVPLCCIDNYLMEVDDLMDFHFLDNKFENNSAFNALGIVYLFKSKLNLSSFFNC